MSKTKRRYFPETFKREAVERVATSGLSVSAVAKELGLHETVLRRWVRHWGRPAAGGARQPAALPPPGSSPADLAAENARLKRDLHRAQAERDILKKAALIFGGASR
jgi:transposase